MQPRLTRYKKKFWGFATGDAYKLEPRPPYPVYAIALGPDDEAGAIQVAGLPQGDAAVAVGVPWIGDITDSGTLLITPRVAGAGTPDPLYAHTLDVLLIHDPACPVPMKRAPLYKRESITPSGTGFLAVVFGRQRVAVSVRLTALTTPGTGGVGINALAPDGNGGGAPQAIRTATGLNNGDVVTAALGESDATLAVGTNKQLWPCQAVYVSVSGGGCVADVIVEAWD